MKEDTSGTLRKINIKAKLLKPELEGIQITDENKGNLSVAYHNNQKLKSNPKKYKTEVNVFGTFDFN